MVPLTNLLKLYVAGMDNFEALLSGAHAMVSVNPKIPRKRSCCF